MGGRRIEEKSDFQALHRAGVLGNRLRQWEDPGAIAADGYAGPVSIRGRLPGMKAGWRTHIPAGRLGDVLREVLAESPGYGVGDYYFSESAPDDRLILQGEFAPTAELPGAGLFVGPYLRYNTAPVAMRRAMAEGFRDVEGSAALAILRHHMTGSSWDDFEILREQYPESAIELGIYDRNLGCFPGRNTIIWEVRNY